MSQNCVTFVHNTCYVWDHINNRCYRCNFLQMWSNSAHFIIESIKLIFNYGRLTRMWHTPVSTIDLTCMHVLFTLAMFVLQRKTQKIIVMRTRLNATNTDMATQVTCSLTLILRKAMTILPYCLQIKPILLKILSPLLCQPDLRRNLPFWTKTQLSFLTDNTLSPFSALCSWSLKQNNTYIFAWNTDFCYNKIQLFFLYMQALMVNESTKYGIFLVSRIFSWVSIKKKWLKSTK